jgi:hypothetical protein
LCSEEEEEIYQTTSKSTTTEEITTTSLTTSTVDRTSQEDVENEIEIDDAPIKNGGSEFYNDKVAIIILYVGITQIWQFN